MTTIHLTNAQRDTFAACGLIVIVSACRFCEEADDYTVPHDEDPVAPEGWRILTEPCSGWQRAGKDEAGNYAYLTPDPDCAGGRRVVTLTATCPHCAGYVADPEPEEVEQYGPQVCDMCGTAGVVALGRFTIPALLPVTASEYGNECPGVPHVHVLRLPGDALVGMCDGHGHAPQIEAVFDPLPRPGQFVVRPEEVK